MFSFASIIAMLEEAATLAPEVIAGIKAAASNPAVVALENLIAPHVTATATPGTALVVEPKAASAA